MYNHRELEKKWQAYWGKQQTYKTLDPDQWHGENKKFYGLVEFPYPSGHGLHVGHIRSYTAMDIITRKKRMDGYHVLFPIGFDAFGLPAENYAIKTKTPPAVTTRENIANFTRQLQSIGIGFDWDRAVETTDPAYYKWTQWIFLELFKKGMAYKASIPINWCINCKIGLANEEVVNGRCERCGGPVEKRMKSQWMLKITAYADRLLNDLESTDYLEKIKTQQREWIGKSEGVNYKQRVKGTDIVLESYDSVPQTFMAQTFAVISPEHPFLPRLIAGLPEEQAVLEFVEKFKRRKIEQGFEIDKEIEGIFTGRFLDNPFGTGDLPIWAASFVVADYGTGFVNCSAHDERDFAFAKKYGIPLKVAMLPKDPEEAQKVKDLEYCYHHDPEGVLLYPEEFKGRTWADARDDIIHYIKEKGFGYPSTNYKLRDWVFSRQRYWGEPIPLVKCTHCAVTKGGEKLTLSFYDQGGWEAIKQERKTIETRALNPEEPERYFDNVKAGDIIHAINKETQEVLAFEVETVFHFQNLSELFDRKDLLPQICSKDIPQTLNEFEKSYEYSSDYVERINRHGLVAWKWKLQSVYVPLSLEQLPLELPKVEHYEPTDSGESPLASVTDWVKTTCPDCGHEAIRETDTMPNWAGSSWYFLRYIDPRNDQVFAGFEKLKYWMPVDWYNGGMEHTTLHLLYSRFWNKFLADYGYVPTSEPYQKRTSHGMILGEGGEKMSKSKGNVVNPDDIVEQYGADTLRLYEMFMGPFDQAIPWDPKGLEGCSRFLTKLLKMQEEKVRSGYQDDRSVLRLLHKTIRKITQDIDSMGFNTAVSSAMIFLNEALKAEAVSLLAFEKFLTVLSPFIPHLAEELWEKTGHSTSIFQETWPAFDAELAKDEEIELVVQISGKVRGRLLVSPAITKEEALTLAYQNKDVKKWLEGKTVRQEIFVPGKIVNIVAN